MKRETVLTGPALQGANKRKRPANTPENFSRQPALTKPIAKIRIGKRHRRDLGDIEQLVASIKDIGLLQPIVVTPDGTLIAGARRLEACKRLGMREVLTRVHDLPEIVRGEFAENTARKDFTLSEAVAIKRTLEPGERAAAKKRMLSGEPSEKFSKGRALDAVAKVVGQHRTTIAKAEAVVDAARAEPEKFGKLLADMDRTGRVNGIYKRLKIARQAEAIRAAPPPLPGRGPYSVIVADPPWPYEVRREDPSHRATYPYPQMSLAEICALDVRALAAPDCVLWLWVTNFHMLNGARGVLDAWGFEPITILTWAKESHGHRVVAARPDRALRDGGSREADRHAHESNNIAARAGALALRKARRVLRSGRKTLSCATLRRTVFANAAGKLGRARR